MIQQKKYSLLSNFIYVLKKIWKYEKKAYLYLVISVFIFPLSTYSWSFLCNYVIDIVTGNFFVAKKILLMSFVCIFFILLIIEILKKIYTTNIGWIFQNVRKKIILEKNKKIMTIDYYFLEDPEFLDLNEKANRACYDDSGFVGMMNSFNEFLIDFFILVLGASFFILLI